MRKILNKLMFVMASAFVVLPSFTGMATAQSNGIGVTPRFNVRVKPGETVEQKAYVTNPSQSEQLTLKVTIVDFKPKDDSGDPELLLKDEATAWSIKKFVKIQDTIVLAPGKSDYVPFTISIPEGQGAGSYYSAIQFNSVTGGGEGTKQVSISAASTSLVFVTVPGDAKELLKLEQFGATENGKFKSIFKTSPSVLSYRVKNEGNVAEQPNGGIVIRNMFGSQVKVIDKANLKKELAIIGQTRKIDVCINDNKDKDGNPTGTCATTNLAPGRYTAEMTILYGENSSREITAKATFWVLPTWFVIAIIAVIALVLFGLYFAYNKLMGASKGRRISRGAGR